MDNLMRLYTTTDGRIGRQQWWIGVVILIVINLVISFLLLPIFGVSMMPNMGALITPEGTADTAAISTAIADGMRRSAWASLILFAIFAYPIYALSIKRRHDKDNSGMDFIIYLGLTALVLLLQALGIGWETMTVGNITLPTPSMWLNVLNIALLVFAVYMLVVLGFLRGTAGPNQYGPDPLGGTAAAAA